MRRIPRNSHWTAGLDQLGPVHPPKPKPPMRQSPWTIGQRARLSTKQRKVKITLAERA